MASEVWSYLMCHVTLYRRSHLNGHVYNVHDTDALWSASIAGTHFTARKASFKERAKAAAEALRGILSDLYANGEGNSAISRERK